MARVLPTSPNLTPTTFFFSSLPKFISPLPLTNPRFHHRRTSVSIVVPFSSSYRNGNNTPSDTQCPVPLEQQPINEYQALSTSFPHSWASGDIVEYYSRLVVTGASFALFIGVPVAWFGTVGAESEPLKRSLFALSSGIYVVTLVVVNMYLGWAYVGNRLLSATIEYEETGWYDGQTWVKTAEVLARDRLLGSFSVKPVLSRLKYTLVGLAASLFLCAFLIINIDGDQIEPYSTSNKPGTRVVPGVYNDESARSFEPDAFCGEPGLEEE